MTSEEAYPPKIIIRAGTIEDLRAALRHGWKDFLRAPGFGVFFGGFFAFGGIVILAMTWALGLSYLAYPTAVGFSLIGPFAAVGLYEVSRRLSAGQDLTWKGVLTVIYAQRRRELGWMAFVTMFMLIMWIDFFRDLSVLCQMPVNQKHFGFDPPQQFLQRRRAFL